MKKYLLLFTALATLTFGGCSNEEDSFPIEKGHHLETNADFIKLSDNQTHTAGELSILTDEPEVTLEWISKADFNIDTTVTTLSVKNGKVVLPIQWQKAMENGKYGPDNLAYRAGVQIKAGDMTKYVPIYWAEKIDTAKVMKNLVQTRAGATPRIAQLYFFPAEVHMSDQSGGVTIATLNGVPFAILDLSDVRSSYNVDVSRFESVLTSTTTMNVNWTSAGHPNFSFTARMVLMSDELISSGAIIYEAPRGGSSNLAYQRDNLPANIPWPGGTYTFYFTGSYTGGIQIRSMVNGVQSVVGAVNYNKQPSITVAANRTYVTKNVTFQYRRDGGDWLALPTSTNRIQLADP